jgi:phage FluMu protein gp41
MERQDRDLTEIKSQLRQVLRALDQAAATQVAQPRGRGRKASSAP